MILEGRKRMLRSLFTLWAGLLTCFAVTVTGVRAEAWTAFHDTYVQTIEPCLSGLLISDPQIIVHRKNEVGVLYFSRKYSPIFYTFPNGTLKKSGHRKFLVQKPHEPGGQEPWYITIKKDDTENLFIQGLSDQASKGSDRSMYRPLTANASMSEDQMIQELKRFLIQKISAEGPLPPSDPSFSELGRKMELEALRKCSRIVDPEIREAAKKAEERYFR